MLVVFRVIYWKIINAIKNIKYFEPTFNGIQQDYKLIDEIEYFLKTKIKNKNVFK